MSGDGRSTTAVAGRGRTRWFTSPSITVAAAVLVLTTAGCTGDPADADDFDVDLSGLSRCPDPLVIQTDWFPRPEHGAVYNLTAGQGSVDPNTGSFTGPLAADPSVTIEIRSGGPPVGDESVVDLMAADEDVFLGFAATDEAIAAYSRHPTTAVLAPLDVNPLMLMWDPASLDIDSWADVKGSGATVHHTVGATFIDYLRQTGMVLVDQLDDGYDGSSDVFVAADGAMIQQGFATREPYLYENVVEEWGRPVDYLLVHDAGYEIYQGALAVLDERLDQDARTCLHSLVPLLQASIVGFQRNPTVTNDLLVRMVDDLDGPWQLTESGATESVIEMGRLGVVGNGGNQVVGDFDLDRVSDVIALMVEDMESVDVPADLEAGSLVTNEFIDGDIGL